MINKKQHFVFVHLGKTGGTSVVNMLRKHQFNFDVIHVHKIKYDPLKKYVLLLRDPIERFISAFNWRYFLLVDDIQKKNWNTSTKPSSKNELELLKKYNTPNALAEDINNFNYEKDYIHHINENLEFYFQNFPLPNKNIIGILNTKSLQEDFQHLFGINELLTREKQNSHYSTFLSEQAKANLLKFLEKEYQIYANITSFSGTTLP